MNSSVKGKDQKHATHGNVADIHVERLRKTAPHAAIVTAAPEIHNLALEEILVIILQARRGRKKQGYNLMRARRVQPQPDIRGRFGELKARWDGQIGRVSPTGGDLL